jgi:hypothetical protein
VPLPLPVHNRYLQQVGPTPLTPLPLEPNQPVIWCKAARRLPVEAQVVTVFPDRMERYFSTELFRGV